MLELICIALGVYYEARGESPLGQLAVASVIVNRTSDPRWPDHACAVIAQPGQFQFYPPTNPPEHSASIEQAFAIAQRALEDSIIPATFFSHPGLLKRTSLLTIDNHEFYLD